MNKAIFSELVKIDITKNLKIWENIEFIQGMVDYSDGFGGFESPHILRPFVALIHSYRQSPHYYVTPIINENVIKVVFPRKMDTFEAGHTFNFEKFDPNLFAIEPSFGGHRFLMFGPSGVRKSTMIRSLLFQYLQNNKHERHIYVAGAKEGNDGDWKPLFGEHPNVYITNTFDNDHLQKWIDSHMGITGSDTGFKNQIEKIVIIDDFQEKLSEKENQPKGTGALRLLWTKYRKTCFTTFLFVQDLENCAGFSNGKTGVLGFDEGQALNTERAKMKHKMTLAFDRNWRVFNHVMETFVRTKGWRTAYFSMKRGTFRVS